MHEIQGQLAKKIVGRALPSLGALRVEHEIPLVDAQAGDVYFEPDPGKERERAALGWLDPLTREPCLLEMIQRTPGPVVVRDNVRKQLTLDHSRALDAKAQSRLRPPLLRLWMLSAGAPRTVLRGYGFTRARDWPRGVWVRSELDAVGVVVLSALPRRRDTLLLRLMGRGRVQREAIADLMDLPEDAKEREIAYEPLVALRMKVAQDPDPNHEERAFLMATADLFDDLVAREQAKGRAQGRAEAHVASLVSIYERRLGTMPERLRKTVAKRVNAETIADWSILFATASAEEIAAALRKGTPR